MLMVVPDILIGKTLSADKFWDKFILRFGLEPLGLWNKCNGYGEKVMVEHEK